MSSEHPSSLTDLSTLQQAIEILQKQNHHSNPEYEPIISQLREQLLTPSQSSQQPIILTPFDMSFQPEQPQTPFNINTPPQLKSFGNEKDYQHYQSEQSSIHTEIPMNADFRSNLLYLQQRTSTPADSPLLSIFANLLKQLDVHYAALQVNYEQTRYYLQQQEYQKVMQILAFDRQQWKLAHNEYQQQLQQQQENGQQQQLNTNNNAKLDQYQPSSSTKAQIDHIHQNYHELLTILYQQYQLNQLYISQDVYQHYQLLFNNPQIHPAINQPLIVSMSMPERVADYVPGLHLYPNRVRNRKLDVLRSLFQQSMFRGNNATSTTHIDVNNNTITTNTIPISASYQSESLQQLQFKQQKIGLNNNAPISTRGTITHSVSLPIFPQHDSNSQLILQQQFYHAYLLSQLNSTQQQLNTLHNQLNNMNNPQSSTDLNQQQQLQPQQLPSQQQQNLQQSLIKPPTSISVFSHYMKERYGLTDYNSQQNFFYQQLIKNQVGTQQQSSQQPSKSIPVDIFNNPILYFPNSNTPSFHIRLNLTVPQSTLTLPLPVHLNIAKLFFQHTNQDVALEKILSSKFGVKASWSAFRTAQGQTKQPQYANRFHLYTALTRVMRANQIVAFPIYSIPKKPSLTSSQSHSKSSQQKIERYLTYRFWTVNEELLTIQSNKVALALGCEPPLPPGVVGTNIVGANNTTSQQNIKSTQNGLSPAAREVRTSTQLEEKDRTLFSRRLGVFNTDKNAVFLAPLPHLYQIPASSSINDIAFACLARSMNFGQLDTLNPTIQPHSNASQYQSNVYNYAAKNQSNKVQSVLQASYVMKHISTTNLNTSTLISKRQDFTQTMTKMGPNHLNNRPQQQIQSPNGGRIPNSITTTATPITPIRQDNNNQQQQSTTSYSHLGIENERNIAAAYILSNDLPSDVDLHELRSLALQYTCYDEDDINNFNHQYYTIVPRITESNKRNADYIRQFNQLHTTHNQAFQQPNSTQASRGGGTHVANNIGQYDNIYSSFQRKTETFDKSCDWMFDFCGLGSMLRIKFVPKMWLEQNKQQNNEQISHVGTKVFRNLNNTRNDNNPINLNDTISTSIWYDEILQTSGVLDGSSENYQHQLVQQQKQQQQQQKQTSSGEQIRTLFNTFNGTSIHGCSDIIVNDSNHSNIMTITPAPMKNNNKNTPTEPQIHYNNNTTNVNNQLQYTTSSQTIPMTFFTIPITEKHNPMLHSSIAAATSNPMYNEPGHQYDDVCIQAVNLDVPSTTTNVFDVSTVLTSINIDNSHNNQQHGNNNNNNQQQQNAQHNGQPQQFLTEVETHIDEVSYQYIDIPLQQLTSLDQRRIIGDYTHPNSFDQYVNRYQLINDIKDSSEKYLSLLKHCAQYTIIPSNIYRGQKNVGFLTYQNPYQVDSQNNNNNNNNQGKQQQQQDDDNDDDDDFVMNEFDQFNLASQSNLIQQQPKTLNQQRTHLSTINETTMINAIIKLIDKVILPQQSILHSLPLYTLNLSTINPQDYIQAIENYAYDSLNKTQYVRQHIIDFKEKNPNIDDDIEKLTLNDEQKERLVTKRWRERIQQFLGQYVDNELATMTGIDANDFISTENDTSVDFCQIDDNKNDSTTNINNNDEKDIKQQQQQQQTRESISSQADFYTSLLQDVTSLKTAKRAGITLQTPFIIQAELLGPVQLKADPKYTCYEELTTRYQLYQQFTNDDYQIIDDFKSSNADNDEGTDDITVGEQDLPLLPTNNTNKIRHNENEYNLDVLFGTTTLTQSTTMIQQQSDDDSSDSDGSDSDDDVVPFNSKVYQQQNQQDNNNEHYHDDNEHQHDDDNTKCSIAYDVMEDEYLQNDYQNIVDRLTLLSYRYIQQEYNLIDIDRQLPPRAEIITDLQQLCTKKSTQYQQQKQQYDEKVRIENERLEQQRLQQIEFEKQQKLQQQQQQQQQQSKGGFFGSLGKVYNNLPSLQQVKNQATNVLSNLVTDTKQQSNTHSNPNDPNNNDNNKQSHNNQTTLTHQLQSQRRQLQQTIIDAQGQIFIPSFTPLHVVLNTRFAPLLTTNIIKLLPYLSTSLHNNTTTPHSHSFYNTPTSSTSTLPSTPTSLQPLSSNNNKVSISNEQRQILGNPILLSQILIQLSQHSTLSYYPHLDRNYTNRMDYLTFASLPRIDSLLQFQSHELGFIKDRLYEPYFTVCLTCRIPSLCPSCSMSCHRHHRQVLFETMMNARHYVRFAQALTELHHHNYLNVPLEWRWGSNNIGSTSYLDSFFNNNKDQQTNKNDDESSLNILSLLQPPTTSQIQQLHEQNSLYNNIHSQPQQPSSQQQSSSSQQQFQQQYSPLPTLSPLAISIYVTLQFIYHLPPSYQLSILLSTFPFFTKKVRTQAYLLPDWCLYEEYTLDVLYHRGTVDLIGKQQNRQTDFYGYLYNQNYSSDIHLTPSTLASTTNTTPNNGGYTHNHEEIQLRMPFRDIEYKRTYQHQQQNQSQQLQTIPPPYKIQRCLCDQKSGWPPHLQPWSTIPPSSKSTQFIYNEKKLKNRICSITPFHSKIKVDFTQEVGRNEHLHPVFLDESTTTPLGIPNNQQQQLNNIIDTVLDTNTQQQQQQPQQQRPQSRPQSQQSTPQFQPSQPQQLQQPQRQQQQQTPQQQPKQIVPSNLQDDYDLVDEFLIEQQNPSQQQQTQQPSTQQRAIEQPRSLQLPPQQVLQQQQQQLLQQQPQQQQSPQQLQQQQQQYSRIQSLQNQVKTLTPPNQRCIGSLVNMGFDLSQLMIDLTIKHSGDVNEVLNELQ